MSVPEARVLVTARVRAEAQRLGFEVVGIARADVAIEPDYQRYLAFVAAGMHGEMTYLAEEPEARRRLDGEHVLPGARSVVCVGKRYARPDAGADPDGARAVARYARGHDYHNHLRKKLRRLAVLLRGLGEGVRARPLCDVEPLLERAWAVRAGLGFIGKNGMLITPGQGSFLLLGEVVTTLELDVGTPEPERCGACTLCLDACPTGAFVRPFVLEPRRCLSYWTIEQQGDVPEAIADAVGDHLFGCDDCQDACPFNRTAAPPLAATARFRPLPSWGALPIDSWLSCDEEGFARATVGSPLVRAGRAGMARNAALVLASRLARGLDPSGSAKRALTLALCHDSEQVRRIARRALGA